MLTVLKIELLDHTIPFLPNHLIDNLPAKGLTYGANLIPYPYSNALKNLIFECLYEIPAHRPSLLELKGKILAGWEIANLECEGEAWADIQAPEPIDLGQAQLDATALLAIQREMIAARNRAALVVEQLTDPGEA